MSRANTPKNAPKYVFNPRNGRVMISTEAKLARVDEYDKPYFIPCNSPKGPGDAKVETAKTEVVPPVEPPSTEDKQKPVKDSGDLLSIVMGSNDKDELVGIGNDIGVSLSRTMKVSTMQDKLRATIEALDSL